MTSQEAKRLIEIVERIVERKMQKYVLTEEKVKPTVFEEKYMKTYTHGMFIDHMLFRKHLREMEACSVQFVEDFSELEGLDKSNETLYVCTGSGNEGLYRYNEETGEFEDVRIGNFYTKEEVDNLIANINVVPEEYDKDVVVVDTYDDLASLESKSTEYLYLCSDTNKLYSYNGSEFVEIAVDNDIIYTTNLDELPEMDLKEGSYTVIYLEKYTVSSTETPKIVLTEFNGKNYTVGVKAIKDVTGLGYRESKLLYGKLAIEPQTILEGKTDEEIIAAASVLRDAGFTFTATISKVDKQSKKIYKYTRHDEEGTIAHRLSNEAGYARWQQGKRIKGKPVTYSWYWIMYATGGDIEILSNRIDSINNTISGVAPVEYDKEVIVVDTYDDLDGIKTKSTEYLYLCSDTNKLYSYDGDEFLEITVDENVIYTDDLKKIPTMDLNEGIYTVINIIKGDTTHNGGDLYLTGYDNYFDAVGACSYILQVSEDEIMLPDDGLPYFVKNFTDDSEANSQVSYWAQRGVYFSYTPNSSQAPVAKVIYSLSVSLDNSYKEYRLSNEYGYAGWSSSNWGWEYYAYKNDLSKKQDKLTAGSGITISTVNDVLTISADATAISVYKNQVADNFIADTTYSGYGYKCDIALVGIVADDIAQVTFSYADSISGKLAPMCDTDTDKVTIYANEQLSSVTIPLILIHHS